MIILVRRKWKRKLEILSRKAYHRGLMIFLLEQWGKVRPCLWGSPNPPLPGHQLTSQHTLLVPSTHGDPSAAKPALDQSCRPHRSLRLQRSEASASANQIPETAPTEVEFIDDIYEELKADVKTDAAPNTFTCRKLKLLGDAPIVTEGFTASVVHQDNQLFVVCPSSDEKHSCPYVCDMMGKQNDCERSCLPGA